MRLFIPVICITCPVFALQVVRYYGAVTVLPVGLCTHVGGRVLCGGLFQLGYGGGKRRCFYISPVTAEWLIAADRAYLFLLLATQIRHMDISYSGFFKRCLQGSSVKLWLPLRYRKRADICQHLYIKRLQHSYEMRYGMNGMAYGVNGPQE